MLPVLAIVVLYMAKFTGLRLGFMATLTAIFCFARLQSLVQLGREFAVTATLVVCPRTWDCVPDALKFAAAEVVFVGMRVILTL